MRIALFCGQHAQPHSLLYTVLGHGVSKKHHIRLQPPAAAIGASWHLEVVAGVSQLYVTVRADHRHLHSNRHTTRV